MLLLFCNQQITQLVGTIMNSCDINSLINEITCEGWSEVLRIKGEQPDPVEAVKVEVRVFLHQQKEDANLILEYEDGSGIVFHNAKCDI